MASIEAGTSVRDSTGRGPAQAGCCISRVPYALTSPQRQVTAHVFCHGIIYARYRPPACICTEASVLASLLIKRPQPCHAKYIYALPPQPPRQTGGRRFPPCFSFVPRGRRPSLAPAILAALGARLTQGRSARPGAVRRRCGMLLIVPGRGWCRGAQLGERCATTSWWWAPARPAACWP